VILKGPRLTLTALDAEAVEAMGASPLLDGMHDFFAARLREDPAALGYWVWLATLADGTEVAAGGFGGRPGDNERLTVGYHVHEDHRGAGYATELLNLLTEWALAQPGVNVVRATIKPENAPSLRVAEKAGFERAGRTRTREDGELLVFLRAR
jgi:[ribosomal protein S5]-alanine N-acetyltransferase